jgi:hypothetical protein
MISHAVKKTSPRNTYEKWKRDGVTRGDEYFYYDHVGVKKCCDQMTPNPKNGQMTWSFPNTVIH